MVIANSAPSLQTDLGRSEFWPKYTGSTLKRNNEAIFEGDF